MIVIQASSSTYDITIFDPATIIDRATYAQPYLYSAGIKYVLVNGVLVLHNGEILADISPGRWMRHTASGKQSME